MSAPRIVVIGAGVGGLAAALALAARGAEVTVLERAATPGGKLREVAVGGTRIDAGPTVFTMRWVFEELFEQAGLSFADHVDTERASTLARHAWAGGAQVDLHADLARSAEAIGEFSGVAESRRFLEFAQRARRIYQTLEQPFMRQSCASPQALMRAVGARGIGDLWAITPFETMWRALGKHFHDPRLRQLFGRYATYCGSSPFQAPATLMLVAHVEQEGVWLVRGGMHRLAQSLACAATSRGAALRFNAEVARIETQRGRVSGVSMQSGERLDCDAVICNADSAAVSEGLFGREAAAAAPRRRGLTRSLSAVTFNLLARSAGFPLLRHSVFFSDDYAAEFDDVYRHARVPRQPTVYVCAQDRGADAHSPTPEGAERLLCLINAPANGDTHAYDAAEIRSCQTRTLEHLQRCGLHLQADPQAMQATTPADFHRLFPATGGALYGPASHGWTASFNRAQAASKLPGLYLAGGSAHPGPGVPMAALSGRIAAARLMADLGSMSRSQTVAMPGGMSMR